LPGISDPENDPITVSIDSGPSFVTVSNRDIVIKSTATDLI
jgi:hypothetical protein